jgi:transglutaminase-like putative cysteine protease
MPRIVRLPLFIIMAVLLSCSNSHLIVDNSYRKDVLNDYRTRAGVYSKAGCDLFSMADTLSDVATREAFQFLLAYLPLSDLATYLPDNLYENVVTALRTREEMPWGPDVPNETFLHFVLPPRVNNENPDDFRAASYNEIKKRVEGLNVVDAALEINRWCQERVSYQPADSRTSSPLATILSARGRCGEESTLAVSALRTAGIPARQVYTPRWAHTDDNHAWVEFWAEGSWHYLGACEPEPVPDRGWFTEPARRAMLVHTRAMGKYDGYEAIVRRENLFAEINTLDRYAVTKELKVRVIDSTLRPVPEAETGYMIYNYAEFYPLARLRCNRQGETSLMTGMGTLLIWADDGNRSGFTVANPADTLVEVIISNEMPEGTIMIDVSVPPLPTPFPGISAELTGRNNLAISRGDSIRQTYINSWMADISVEELSFTTGIPAADLEKVLRSSMGNYREIASFISSAATGVGKAMRILGNISAKDLRDTPAEVLTDHLVNGPDITLCEDTSLYYRYVLSPRISNELLSPFRSVLRQIPSDLFEVFRAEPVNAAAWMDTVITVNETDNYYGTPVTPAGVMKLRMADPHSRDIFFVALCRTAGIPSRLAPGTDRPQYYSDGEWHEVWFAGEATPRGDNSYVTFRSTGKGPEPEYHVHFSLAQINDGQYQTLDYGYGTKVSDLPERIKLAPGQYMLTTGNRDENGNVYSSLLFFTLASGEEKSLEVTLRPIPETEVPCGKANLSGKLVTYSGDSIDLKVLSNNGVVLIWMEPGKEPTRHLLNDLPLLTDEFNAWDGYFIFLAEPSGSQVGYDTEGIDGMPDRSVFAEDKELYLMTSILGEGSDKRSMPVVIYCDREGNITYMSEGYRIGTGEQILKKFR